jgi:hypothetical protein
MLYLGWKLWLKEGKAIMPVFERGTVIIDTNVQRNGRFTLFKKWNRVQIVSGICNCCWNTWRKEDQATLLVSARCMVIIDPYVKKSGGFTCAESWTKWQ